MRRCCIADLTDSVLFVFVSSPSLDVATCILFLNVGGRRDKHTAPANEAQYVTSRKTYLRSVFRFAYLSVLIFLNMLPFISITVASI